MKGNVSEPVPVQSMPPPTSRVPVNGVAKKDGSPSILPKISPSPLEGTRKIVTSQQQQQSPLLFVNPCAIKQPQRLVPNNSVRIQPYPDQSTCKKLPKKPSSTSPENNANNNGKQQSHIHVAAGSLLQIATTSNSTAFIAM